jgi:two-component system, NtrC family, sensor kinase
MSDKLALVIEDDFDASVIFAKALEVLGFNVEIIRSGDLAHERLKVVVPDIIILDMHLPHVVGTTLIRQIREDERMEETRVIIATADPRTAETVQPLADLVLIKPTTFSQVRDLASRLISRPRSHSKLRSSEPPPTQEISPDQLPTQPVKKKQLPTQQVTTEQLPTPPVTQEQIPQTPPTESE